MPKKIVHTGTYRIAYYNDDTKAIELGQKEYANIKTAQQRFEDLKKLPVSPSYVLLAVVQIVAE